MPNATQPASVTGLILAGGRGERVGGVDKGWIDYRGHPLILHVVERLAPQVRSIVISANRTLERYAQIAAVVSDADAHLPLEPFAGPLIGVLAGLRRAQTEWTAIVPCDAPHLPPDLVQRLTHAVANGHHAAHVQVQGAMQPAFALVRTSCATSLEPAVRSGERALHRWLASLPSVPVEFDDPRAFANINTLADLKAHNRSTD